MNASIALASLATEYWEKVMTNEPLYATSLGDRRFDHKLPDLTPDGLERELKEYRDLLERAYRVREQELSADDMITKRALLVELHQQIDFLSCGLEEWIVDPLSGPQIELLNVESYQPVRTWAEANSMVRRWNAMGPYLKDHIANLRRGLLKGKTAVRSCVEKTLQETADELQKPDHEWPLLRPLTITHADWSDAQRADFDLGLKLAVKDSIRPAFQVYLEFLRDEILPKCRPDDKPGISHLPGGYEDYQRLIQIRTSLNMTPEELHEIGLREVARINGEMEELGGDYSV